MVLTSTAMATIVDQTTQWIHPNERILSADGVRYQVTYLGSVEVLSSMKALDFENRTKVARDSIRLICIASGFHPKDRYKTNEISNTPSLIGTQANLTHHRAPVELIINTDALRLKRLSNSQTIFSHRMEGISFASAGEFETKDYIAYVAKDNLNGRACHVLICQENESIDVITTIGQAFELRYNEYLKAQEKQQEQQQEQLNLKQNKQQNVDDDDDDEPAITSLPRARFDDDSNELINEDDISNHDNWNSAKSSDILKQKWFHGKISRDEAELLLKYPGDFLVRESIKVPGQYILSGRTRSHFKHLLLVDPDGVIRTKDYEFDSIEHLISYHQAGSVPIISADSELHLQTPISRRF